MQAKGCNSAKNDFCFGGNILYFTIFLHFIGLPSYQNLAP